MPPAVRSPQRDRVFFVNAFADSFSRGNTAAVVILEAYPGDAQMLALAAEFNFSETAFVVPLANGRRQIRWFTPEVEVPLCGHATLAAAAALLAEVESGADKIEFDSLSGPLTARRRGEAIELDFPSDQPVPAEAGIEVLEAVSPQSPAAALSARGTRNLMLVYDDPRTVLELQPDFARLKLISGLPWFGIAATAPGIETDYLCRYFAPWEGINEDPVTGSAQTFLAPWWARRLGKSTVSGYQASRRGGRFEVEVLSSRVLIRGRYCIWLAGEVPSDWRECSGL